MTNGMSLDDWFLFVLKSIGALWILIHTKKIFAIIRESFGHFDKAELASMIFTPVLIFMIVQDGSRGVHDPYKFGIVALIVMYGFGLRPVLNFLLVLRGINPKTIDENKNRDSSGSDFSTSDGGAVPPKQP